MSPRCVIRHTLDETRSSTRSWSIPRQCASFTHPRMPAPPNPQHSSHSLAIAPWHFGSAGAESRRAARSSRGGSSRRSLLHFASLGRSRRGSSSIERYYANTVPFLRSSRAPRRIAEAVFRARHAMSAQHPTMPVPPNHAGPTNHASPTQPCQSHPSESRCGVLNEARTRKRVQPPCRKTIRQNDHHHQNIERRTTNTIERVTSDERERAVIETRTTSSSDRDERRRPFIQK